MVLMSLSTALVMVPESNYKHETAVHPKHGIGRTSKGTEARILLSLNIQAEL